jgi:hypothetical protein
MQRALTCSMVLALISCAKKESDSSSKPAVESPSGSSARAPSTDSPAGSGSARAAAETAPPAGEDSGGEAEVADLVVRSVGSKALGGQTIDPACVAVTIMPAGDWTVATARLKDCGDKNARSIVWIYKRKTGKWNEDYAGQPPKCWKGLPPDIAVAVKMATRIPSC